VFVLTADPPNEILGPAKFLLCDNAGFAAVVASSATAQQIVVVFLVIIFFPLFIN
jgi:hypothetical protein